MASRDDLIAFGTFIRDRRKDLGLTQSELGARIGWAQERVSVLERGKYGLPSLPQLCRLADALAISLGWLLQELGIDGLQGSAPDREQQAGQSTHRIDLRLGATLDQMHVVERNLHDAEQQVQRADVLRASIRERRQQITRASAGEP